MKTYNVRTEWVRVGNLVNFLQRQGRQVNPVEVNEALRVLQIKKLIRKHGAVISHQDVNRFLAYFDGHDLFEPVEPSIRTKADVWQIVTAQDCVDHLRDLGYTVTCTMTVNL